MSETKEFNSLPVLSEVQEEREHAQKRSTIASVRNSPGPYLAFASVVTFIAALTLRAHQDALALIMIGAAWLLVPVIALSDRIAFDGASLRRHGPLASLLHLLFGYRKQLAIDDFETVETQAVRTLRRGGRVRYRYRTQITGKGKEFVIVSGGRDYRKLVRELFPLIHESKLDNRSRDLRDYLNDPRFLNRKTQLSQLAPSDLLDVTRPDFRLGRKLTKSTTGAETPPTPEEVERALLLRSQASAQSDARLLSRARAALRLASMRAKNDIVLLPLIGESFLECGDATHARRALQKVVEIDSGNFKARVGLADIALREGKLAHVIHHYQEAARVSSEQALARYARGEGDYYMQLNNDDDYLATELRRINWLQSVTRIRRLALRVTNASVLLALIGGFVDPVAGSLGWSLASSALIIWLLTLAGTRMLFARSKP